MDREEGVTEDRTKDWKKQAGKDKRLEVGEARQGNIGREWDEIGEMVGRIKEHSEVKGNR